MGLWFICSVAFTSYRKLNVHTSCIDVNIKVQRRVGGVVCMGMLAPRKFLQKRKKQEVFRDAADEAEQKNWRRLMNEIEETGSAVAVLRSERMKNREIPKDLVLGTLVRFKQLKKWKLVSEVHFHLHLDAGKLICLAVHSFLLEICTVNDGCCL